MATRRRPTSRLPEWMRWAPRRGCLPAGRGRGGARQRRRLRPSTPELGGGVCQAAGARRPGAWTTGRLTDRAGDRGLWPKGGVRDRRAEGGETRGEPHDGERAMGERR